jgi:hypothetical protein
MNDEVFEVLQRGQETAGMFRGLLVLLSAREVRRLSTGSAARFLPGTHMRLVREMLFIEEEL